MGCGPIGLLLLQLSRNANAAQVTAVEPLAHRRDKARELRADVVLAPEETAEHSGSCDLVFEVNGNPAAVAEAIELAKPGARVVLVGIPDEDQTTFVASHARRKGLTLVCVRRMKEVYDRAIALVERGHVDAETLVSHVFAPEDVDQAFKTGAARDGHKIVVEFSKSDR